MSTIRFRKTFALAHGRTTKSIVAALLTAAMLVWAGPALAQQSKCLAGKTKCATKKGTGLLKCETLAETPGKPADPNAGGCHDKVVGKFDGGIDPSKGCFEKLENKNPNDCITFDDTSTAEAVMDSCVAAFVTTIDPPPLSQTKCGAGKKKCVSKYMKSLFKCTQLAQTPGKSTNPNFGGCVDKAQAKYTGGPDPSKGCFAKLEAVNPNDCQISGDSNTLKTLVENCLDDLVAVETNTTTTSSTTLQSTTTSTSLPGGGVILQGALPPTTGRFNFNLTLGLPGANAACNSTFAGTHACSYAELQNAEAAGDLVGLKDVNNTTVTSFWAIDNSAPPLQQCQDDALNGSLNNWEYGTAHTVSRGSKVPLTNGTGVLGSLMTGLQCNLSGNSWVGCCL